MKIILKSNLFPLLNFISQNVLIAASLVGIFDNHKNINSAVTETKVEYCAFLLEENYIPVKLNFMTDLFWRIKKISVQIIV